MDGFDQTVNVKVIMATNRADTLDPALLRPGRLDRKIEFPLPDRRQKRLIFSTITSRMNLSEEVDLEDYVARPDKISGADINAICQEVCNFFENKIHQNFNLNHISIKTNLSIKISHRLACKQYAKIVI